MHLCFVHLARHSCPCFVVRAVALGGYETALSCRPFRRRAEVATAPRAAPLQRQPEPLRVQLSVPFTAVHLLARSHCVLAPLKKALKRSCFRRASWAGSRACLGLRPAAALPRAPGRAPRARQTSWRSRTAPTAGGCRPPPCLRLQVRHAARLQHLATRLRAVGCAAAPSERPGPRAARSCPGAAVRRLGMAKPSRLAWLLVLCCTPC